MLQAFLVLLGFQFVGTAVGDALHLPVPGPVIGMFLLATALLVRRHWIARSTTIATPMRVEATTPQPLPSALTQLARGLIAALGLLFVPAGIGVVQQWPRLWANALPITVALVGSTVLGLLVTALVMQALTRHEASSPTPPGPTPGGQVL